jgi:hypothetical protein
MGMEMNTKSAVITAGPAMVHQNAGSAATPKSHNPHQKSTSPR